MCGQMKTMLDRANPLYAADYAFRDVYLIATAAEDADSAIEGTITGVTGWVSCFEKATLKGILYGKGLQGVGDAKEADALLKEAYEMGKNC